MNNVKINSKPTGGDKPVKLNNGSLVLHYNKLGDVVGAYIVTSYRDSNFVAPKSKSSYCSFVDLDTGYIKFEENCSRTTTVKRVLSHLNPGDYGGEKAIAEGQYIKVFSLGNYSIDLNLSLED